MSKIAIAKIFGVVSFVFFMTACTPDLNVTKTVNTTTPESFGSSKDTVNTVAVVWSDYFNDQNLIALIDTALKNNQELNIMLQEIEISKNEVMSRKGEYIPQVGVGAGIGIDKVGRYTRNGVLEANNDIRPGVEFPEPLGDYMLGLNATWEVDIWKKLRNAKQSAYMKYLASIEGKNFMVTNLVAEIANSYYELLALDNQFSILKQNIALQSSALEIVKLQKQSARVTELAVRRFQGQVYYTKSLQFGIQQQIIETENKLNMLLGRYPQTIQRDSDAFEAIVPMVVKEGIPSQLLENRPDVRKAELDLSAAKLDVSVAKARFYPSLGLSADVGFQAYNAGYFLKAPESLLYGMAGEIAAPLLNRNAIKAAYFNANATQIQTVYNYEQTLINAYLEVANQLAKFQNLASSYELKTQQVQALTESIEISNNLFKSARADYMEVLLTQREALDSRFELIETKMQQMNTSVNLYRALGGGWK